MHDNKVSRDTQNDSQKQLINLTIHLFGRAKIIWGRHWSNNFGDDPDSIALAINEWSRALVGVTKKQLDDVIDKLSLTCEWPPTMAQFLNHLDDLSGYPDARTIINAAIRGDFGHFIIKAVYDMVGSWAFRNDSDKELMQKVSEARKKVIHDIRMNRSIKGIEHVQSQAN